MDQKPTQYTVTLKKSCAKDMERVPQNYRRTIQEFLNELELASFTAADKLLTGSDKSFSKRFGKWRVIYTVDSDCQRVEVCTVGARKNVYKRRR
ncbi:hypothetical protein TNIN_454081 [Trichonephila inaurata madagascariensis]|uniref:Type II toxin-antitoxin system RelE/ParE family toxin n=1 Tax=Trichonephila inaurata madagascariensis TaxID=2747483 RepID=A0A8X6YQW0_9ARAC|nr:hypothetical protein TNIN_454081 [Trichonephila inaurata madagascariensis]